MQYIVLIIIANEGETNKLTSYNVNLWFKHVFVWKAQEAYVFLLIELSIDPWQGVVEDLLRCLDGLVNQEFVFHSVTIETCNPNLVEINWSM